MKKIYALFLLGAMLSSTAGFAQTGSVTLTPPTGTPVSYASIGAAYAAIPTPLSGNYLIELQTPYDGTSETFPIQLTDKGLAAGGFRITIRPAASNNGEIIQRPAAAAGVVLQMNGGDNITLDGRPGSVTSSVANYLSINDAFSGSNTNRNIELLNAANNNIIQYVKCTAADATAAGAGSRVILVGSTATTANLNNTIQFCNVTGGLRGIQDFGLSDAIPNSGTKILSDTVRNFGAIGIFAGTAQSNITIQNNYVSLNSYNVLVTGTSVTVTGIQQQSLVAGTSNILNNTISLVTTSATVTTLNAIYDVSTATSNITGNNIIALSMPSTATATTNVVTAIGVGATVSTVSPSTYNISRNKVSGLSSTGAVQFRGLYAAPFTGSTINVNNNFVSITDANSLATLILGMLFDYTGLGYTYTSNIYYNSIRIGGSESSSSTGSAYGIYKNDQNGGSTYRQINNISIIERTGGAASSAYFIGFYIDTTAGTNTINFNTYYATDATNGYAAGGWDGFIYRNSGLTSYKTSASPQEQNSNFSTVTFVSNTDLHLAPPSSTATSLYGMPVTGVTTDIDNGVRSATNPFQGADEPGVGVPIQLLTFAGEKKGMYNLLQWATATEVNNNGFYLERSVDGTHFNSLGFIASKATNGNSVAQLNYTFSDEKPLSVKGFYRLKQVDKDSKTTYSAIVVLSENKVAQLTIAGIYPNPVTNSFNLIVNTPAEGKVAIAIIGITGQALLQQQRSLTAGNNIVPMNVVSLPAGIYTIKVTNLVSNETITTRFVK